MRSTTLFALALLFVMNSPPASGQIAIPAGSDLFTTAGGGGQTFIDFSDTPIPADFFGPGSDPFSGQVELRGLPLNDNPGLAPPENVDLGLTDTIIRRNGDIDLTGPGDTETVPVEIVALSLVSVEPITVTFGETSTQWQLEVQTLFGADQFESTMTVRQDSDVGGTLDIMIPVTNSMYFQEVDAPTFNGRELQGYPVGLVRSGIPWATSTPLTPVTIDEAITLANMETVPPTSPNFFFFHDLPDGSTNPLCHLTFTEIYNGGRYAFLPSFVQPPDSDPDGDFVPSDCDNCADQSNPLQEDADGDHTGDVCEPTGFDCVPGDEILCLNGGRFQVSVSWRDFANNDSTLDPADRSGAGTAMALSDDSGLFYFFNPDNWEMLVKVLDGCDFNSHFWVFAAATTNVEYTLTVTDTQTSEFREVFQPAGNPRPGNPRYGSLCHLSQGGIQCCGGAGYRRTLDVGWGEGAGLHGRHGHLLPARWAL